MAVITVTQNSSNIKSKYDIRLSAQYYHLKQQMTELKSQGNEIHLLSEIAPQIDSGSYINNYVEKGTRYIRVGDLKKYVIDMSDSAFIEREKAKAKMILAKNDICFARTQATYDKLGNFTIIDELNNGEAISQHVSKICPKQYVSSEYLVAYLNSKFGKRQMCLASYGDTRVELTHNQTKEIEVISLDDEIVKIIEDKVKQLLLCNRKAYIAFKSAQEVMDEEFYNKIIDSEIVSPTKQLLIDNNLWSPACYNPEYIKTINCIRLGFEHKKLRELIKPIQKGVEVGSENYLIEMERSSGDLPFIRTSDIFNNEIDYAPDYFVSRAVAIKSKCPKLNNDDIIFSKDGKVGEVGIINIPDSIVPSSGFSILRSNGIVSSNYLFAILSHKEIVKNQAKMKTVIAATIPHLKPDKICDFYIPIFEKEKRDLIDGYIAEFRDNISKKQLCIRQIETILNEQYNKLFFLRSRKISHKTNS